MWLDGNKLHTGSEVFKLFNYDISLWTFIISQTLLQKYLNRAKKYQGSNVPICYTACSDESSTYIYFE